MAEHLGVGKAGRHLERGASIPYNGLEVKVSRYYRKFLPRLC